MLTSIQVESVKAAKPVTSPPQPTATPTTVMKKAPTENCRDFAKGRCKRGERCPYAHPPEVPPVVPTQTAPAKFPVLLPTAATPPYMSPAVAEPVATDEYRPPCITYMTRNMKCPNGRQCWRLHPPVCEWKKVSRI